MEILSDGRVITVMHDGKDQEVFHLHGARDQSKFADPLMLLVQSYGSGELREFSVIKSVQAGDTLITQVQPSNHNGFEAMKNATLWIDDSGQLKRVSINFKSGDVDETEFKSWMLLAQSDPEILSLNDRLSRLIDQGSNPEARKREDISADNSRTPEFLAERETKPIAN